MSQPPRPPRPPRPLSAEFMRLKQLQNRSKNLTTYLDGDLVEVPYPTTASGQLVDADKLWKHVKTHLFGPLHCFHDIPVRMFIPLTGRYGGLPIAACGHRQQRSEDCKFWIMLGDIHANGENQLLVHEYPARVQSQALAFSSPTPTSSQSSLSATSASQDAQPGSAGSEQAPNQSVPASETINQFYAKNQLILHEPSLLDILGFNEPAPLNPSATMAMGPDGASANHSRAARPRLSDRMRSTFRQSNNLSASSNSTPSTTRDNRPGPSRIRMMSPPVCIGTSFKALRDVAPLPRIGVAPPNAPVHYSEPAGGVFKALMGLDDDTGIPLRVLWSMFVVCEICSRGMVGRRLEDHVCDLTYDSN
ncbi:hypothetical protein BDZ97DRAFT_1921943 [Flammula alnicola]|nr:hypothetical protein BDZ97DRAFT_1921943 [Flammula alnicola]